jgi:GntR family transcriptional repressor for pyruvate dehydrogenase complex
MLILMFQPAKQNRIYQDVVDQVQEAIVSGRLRPGDSLPSERQLRKQFGVSRGTLREALRVLEEKRLIEIRLGLNGGALVREANADAVSEGLAFLIRHRMVSLAHLAEFRESVEGLVTEMAARRATADDVQALLSLMHQAAALVKTGISRWDAFVRIDERLHMKLADAAANPIFRLVLRSVHDNIHRYYDRFLSMGESEMMENYNDLQNIVDAVATHDADRAGRLAREHVRRFNRYMEKKMRRETI